MFWDKQTVWYNQKENELIIVRTRGIVPILDLYLNEKETTTKVSGYACSKKLFLKSLDAVYIGEF